MTENKVRTQIDLSQTTYDRLKTRAEKQGLSLTVQIEEALGEYLNRVETTHEANAVFDPASLLASIDSLEESGPSDLAERHDAYIYGDNQPEASPQARTKLTPKLRESKSVYKTRKRPAAKKSTRRKNRS